jgi:hypothetical protein
VLGRIKVVALQPLGLGLGHDGLLARLTSTPGHLLPARFGIVSATAAAAASIIRREGLAGGVPVDGL